MCDWTGVLSAFQISFDWAQAESAGRASIATMKHLTAKDNTRFFTNNSFFHGTQETVKQSIHGRAVPDSITVA
jgi:hypothetical protein